MKLFITGAGGFVASNLRMRLVTDGHHAVCASRRRIPSYGNEIAIQTEYSGDAPARMRGCDAAIHLAGSGAQTIHNQYAAANHLLARTITRWCRDSAIPRIIYFSGLGASAGATTSYFISKYMAEQEIRESGLDYVIFRPAHIIGRDDYLSRNLRDQLKTGSIIVPGSGEYHIQPVSIRDVVEVLLRAVSGDTFRNRTLDMVGPRAIPFKDYIRIAAGKDAPIRHIEMEEAYRRAVRGEQTSYGVDDLNILVGGFVGDHRSLREASGFEFHDFSEAGRPP